MNGLEFLITLRAGSNCNTPVVILSHSNDDALAIRCIEKGAQDFINKSEVTASRLIRSIMHASERHKIEQELRESREQLRYLAEVDALTGLANRYIFEQALRHALPLSARQNTGLALVILDLDKFKDVNDTLGHAVGDELLKEVAQRIKSQVRDGDILCRLGGDEFAILIHSLEDIELVRRFSQRVIQVLQKPICIEGHVISVSASMGIASFPDCASDPIQLMKCADVALYRAKDEGRNQAHLYSKALHEKIQCRIELENDLRGALSRDEFILYYQPQISMDNDQVTGVEALIRWIHPTRGLIAPDNFIPIAEDLGLINNIGAWVLETSCKQFQHWRNTFNAVDLNLSISVNLSALQLSQDELVDNIKKIMEKYDIPNQCLELELTESAVTKNIEVSTALLQELAKSGITLAMDDFGTGYSSLLQLKNYPFQVLKIDKTFIQSISDSEDGALYLKAINAFAKILGLEVVAEGVETKQQLDLCRKLQFDRIQGYYFSRPIPPNDFEKKYLVAPIVPAP